MSGQGFYGTVTVGTDAVEIFGGRSVGKGVLIQNVHATQVLYVGTDDSVTDANGIRLNPGESVETKAYTGQIYGIADGADTDVRYLSE